MLFLNCCMWPLLEKLKKKWLVESKSYVAQADFQFTPWPRTTYCLNILSAGIVDMPSLCPAGDETHVLLQASGIRILGYL